MGHQPKHIYEFGPFRLDAVERLLLRDGESVPLTPKSFDLLLALIEQHGHLLEKYELMKKVWPDTFVEEANLSYNISLIRKALGEGENGKKYIETVPKRGYRFAPQVREVKEKSEALAATDPVNWQTSVVVEPATDPQAAAPGDDRKPTADAPFSIRPALWRLLAVALGVSLAAIAVISYTGRSEDRGVPPKSLAVLPFADMSPTQDQQYFSDGISEEVLNVLAQVKDLRVEFPTRRGTLVAVDDVSFELAPGEVMGLVGESGSGKSVTAKALMQLNPDNAAYGPQSRITLMLEDGPVEVLRLRTAREMQVVRAPNEPGNEVLTWLKRAAYHLADRALVELVQHDGVVHAVVVTERFVTGAVA